MELRVLRYFLEAAREGNITRAAERLHVSQPTVSKQIKELEEELGTKLFIRSNYSIRLTDAGMLLRERAADIIELVDKTKNEFSSLEEINSGDIYVGAAESDSISLFADALHDLQKSYPKIRCNIMSGNMEDVCERLDKGLLDFAIVMSYVDLSKYNYLKVPSHDVWGVLMKKGDPLAAKTSVTVGDIRFLPLICSRQWLNQDFPQWFGKDTESADIAATFNLNYNAAVMVRSGIGYAITYDKLSDVSADSDLTFRPLEDVPASEMYVIWRKYQTFTPAANLLIEELQRRFL
ncbi:MAG: LysR family transcriptional regulator [Clostridia bacterium]|nr:LysR family transcriptional regulator [Clostridia bacterium]